MSILRFTRWGTRPAAVLAVQTLIGLMLAACAGDPGSVPKTLTRAPIVSALPQLPQLAPDLRPVVPPDLDLAFGVDSVRVMISVELGARVNALLPPVIEGIDGRRFILRAPTVTEDSAYFVERASITLPRTALPIRGTLRTSFCRSDERLCRSAVRDVVLENQ
ncbi:hypothetical protein [Gemmatimonas sp.]|uniref:hypothetical protein n=1 Tax=Gemmatimonas sp. TaxID=1962908 RepID=UPI00356AAD0F